MENEKLPQEYKPEEMMPTERAQMIAKELVAIVKELKWSKRFGGEKDHLEIEAWQFIAAKDRGATPSIIEDHEITDKDGNFIGFVATAALIRDGEILTRAIHECTIEEKNWENKPRYSLRGMAQTRAMSRVCRNRYAWIARMGGFAGTPADEMGPEFTNKTPKPPKEQKQETEEDPQGEKTASWDVFWKSVTNAGYKDKDRKSMNEFIAQKSQSQKMSKTDVMIECMSDFKGFILEWEEWKK